MNKLFSFAALLFSFAAYAEEPLVYDRPMNYTFEVITVEVADNVDIHALCLRQGTPQPAKGYHLVGCSTFDDQTNTLTIWVRPPRYVGDDERFAIIGHELWHGVAGRFHK
jgi:hypothetical protein